MVDLQILKDGLHLFSGLIFKTNSTLKMLTQFKRQFSNFRKIQERLLRPFTQRTCTIELQNLPEGSNYDVPSFFSSLYPKKLSITKICMVCTHIIPIKTSPTEPTISPALRKASGIAKIPVPIFPLSKWMAVSRFLDFGKHFIRQTSIFVQNASLILQNNLSMSISDTEFIQ